MAVVGEKLPHAVERSTAAMSHIQANVDRRKNATDEFSFTAWFR